MISGPFVMLEELWLTRSAGPACATQGDPAPVRARSPVFESYLTGEPITVPVGTVDM